MSDNPEYISGYGLCGREKCRAISKQVNHAYCRDCDAVLVMKKVRTQVGAADTGEAFLFTRQELQQLLHGASVRADHLASKLLLERAAHDASKRQITELQNQVAELRGTAGG